MSYIYSSSRSFDSPNNITTNDKLQRLMSLIKRDKQKITKDSVETQDQPQPLAYFHEDVDSFCQHQQNAHENFQKNVFQQYYYNPDDNASESVVVDFSTQSLASIDLDSNSGNLIGQVSSTSVHKFHELFAIASKERDELKQENESLKRELSYSKCMLEGYKNAFTELELEMRQHLQTQQEYSTAQVAIDEEKDVNLPPTRQEFFPRSLIRIQNCRLPSTHFLNNDNKNVEGEDDGDNVESFPENFQTLNTHEQEQKENKQTNSTKGNHPVRKGLLFLQSSFKRTPKHDIKLPEKKVNHDISNPMEEVIIDNYDKDQVDILWDEIADDSFSRRNG